MIVAMGYRSAGDASMKPIVAFVLMGVIGGAAGFLLALVVQPFPEHPITVAAPVLAVAAPYLGGSCLYRGRGSRCMVPHAPHPVVGSGALPVPALRHR
jgi:ribose/xylose/arabinose/galactoside ABC-type transport system permease subunit